MLGLIIAIVLLVVVVFGILLMSYVKAPPDMAYVISGIRKRVIIGRAGIRIPFLERVDKLNLQMMSVDVKTGETVPTNNYIDVNYSMIDDRLYGVNCIPELLFFYNKYR